MPTPPLITLTTDFGTRNAYVASMKGVILRMIPEAIIVDISHDIAAWNIVEGGFTLACACSHFPAGTIHVLVVDPGVGTQRRLLIARTEDHLFLAPDNGALGMVLERTPPVEMVQILAGASAGAEVSATFHGRDILAPAAARLASGAALTEFGPPVDRFVPFPLPPPAAGPDGAVILSVILVDRFGNVIFNLHDSHLLEWGVRPESKPVSLEINGGRLVSRMVRTYGEAADGELVLLINSEGYLELAASRGSAASILGASQGMAARLRL